MADASPNGPNALNWRLTEYERRMARADDQIEKLWDRKADAKDVELLSSDMQSVRKALYSVAASVLVGALLLLGTVVILTGGPA